MLEIDETLKSWRACCSWAEDKASKKRLLNEVTVGAAERGTGEPRGTGAPKLNPVMVAAADKGGVSASGADVDGAKLNDVSTSIRSEGVDGMSRG